MSRLGQGPGTGCFEEGDDHQFRFKKKREKFWQWLELLGSVMNVMGCAVTT
jgi:hypothetical protein